jgi:signal transduction histidine kinase
LAPLLRRRLIAFCAVILALVLLAGWSARTSWIEIGALRRRFTTAQFESFRIAGQLESSILDANSALLAYDTSGSAADWKTFKKLSGELDAWIDRQRDVLRTTQERSVLADIDAEYDRYLAVADTMRQERGERDVPDARRVHQLNEAAKRMFALASRLADAHSAALGELLGENQRSLRKLEMLFGAGFLLVLGVGAWGTRVMFRETIAPLRRQLIESQALAERHEKLASLGVLAAGVAHEIRNPLTAIKTRIFTLRRRLAGDPAAAEDAAIVEREIDRLERVVRDFLLFARPADPELSTLTPRGLFQNVCELLAPELAAQAIELYAEPGADETVLRADAHQLQQVLINLIRNAAESIGFNGRITLRARRDRLPLAGALTYVLVIEVSDTGSGIPADVQERLFDPFFTTKSAGTGLGLSIALRVVERHGGTLQFQTAPGSGTTFGIVLPLPAEATAPEAIPRITMA